MPRLPSCRSLLAGIVFFLCAGPTLAVDGARILEGDALAAPPPRSSAAAEIRALDALRANAPMVQGVQLRPVGRHPAAGDRTLVRVRQEVGGIPLFRGDHKVFLGPAGQVEAVVLGEGLARIPPLEFRLGTAEATARAREALGGPRPSGGWTAGIEELDRSGPHALVALPDRIRPAHLRPTVVAGASAPAWRVDLAAPGDPSRYWSVLVHAGNGRILGRYELTRHAAAQGRVWPRGALQPSELRDFVDADLVLDLASPLGWIFEDRTEGNNLRVWEDRAGDGGTTEGLQTVGTGDPLTFDFPFTGSPLDDLDAALTNVFWALNHAHDLFWHLGLDEATGALQADHFGRGEATGLDGDWTRVYVQYRAGPNATGIRNSNTAYAAPDGGYNNITVGLWDRSGEIRDGALDTGLLYHEYAHLAVSRLVGNDVTCDDGIQPRPLAEGWADYFAYAFTGDRVIGAWVSGDEDVGLRLRQVGDHFFTLANFCNVRDDNNCRANDDGEIWSAVLYDIRQAFLQTYGEEGAEMADRLIVEGMRYTPCAPTFLEARDAILAADRALANGRDHCLLWNTFRMRGLGASAATEGPEDENPVFALDVPPQCAGGADIAWDRERYGDDADARLLLADASLGAGPRSIRVTTGGGDEETLEASGSGLLREALAPLRPGAPVPDDGLVQVVEGETITATCTDCPGAPQAAVSVSRSLDVVVNFVSLSSESCHDDDGDPNIDDFRNEVSGILDAGETANLNVDLGNNEPFPLEDVVVTVTTDHPAVHVVPEGPIPLGGVARKTRFARSFRVPLRVLVEPAPAVSFGEEVTLSFQVEARGLAGQTAWTMPLAADYADERGLFGWGSVETFETDSPTAAQWQHFPEAGLPGDQWGIQDCGDGGGRAMSYSGPDCGLYDDGPTAAALVSPPLFEGRDDIQSIHLLDFAWRNEVDLAYDPRTNYCDSEMVLLYVEDDDGGFIHQEPRNQRFAAAHYWAQWPQFFDTHNTSGYEAQTPRNTPSDNTLNRLDLDRLRLYLYFYTDVLNPENNGGCRTSDPDAVATGFRLDNVRFEVDAVKVVPAADNSCTASCIAAAHGVMDPPAGARCPGDALSFSAEASSAWGCPGGELEYRLRGPGGFDTGYGDVVTFEATSEGGGYWTVSVRCKQLPDCADSFGILDRTLADGPAGGIRPDSLRVRREGGQIRLDWDGNRAPSAYAVFGGQVDRFDGSGRLALLDLLAGAPPDDTARLADPEERTWSEDPGPFTGSVRFYRVTSRMPCSGAAVVP